MASIDALIVLILAQAPVSPPADVATAASTPLGIDSAFDFLMKGGWAMIPIALCSLFALTIIVERMMVLRKRRVAPRAVVEHLKTLAGDPVCALEYCRSVRNPITRILEVALKDADEPQLVMEKHVEEAGGREVVSLRQRMRVLSSLPQVATMLGLLGTVFGMIKTFQAVASTSEALGKTEMLAKGIFEAWTCTAAGLLVAVPVLVMYHHLMGRIDSLVAEIDRVVSEWLEQSRVHRAVARSVVIENRRVITEITPNGENAAIATVAATV